MDLLVFAHRGEAMTFLKELELKSNSQYNDLYQNGDTLLLITKEGPHEVLVKLSYALGLFPNIKRIINLGICGSLNKEIELESIHKPRTIYKENEFKSFQCNSNENKDSVDLITTEKRILTEDDASALKNFATLVDREAHAVAQVAKTFNKTFEVYKLVSDHITDAKFCERIKENAQLYSDKLYDFYDKNIQSSSSKAEQNSELEILRDSDFYFSVSQRRIFNNLYKSLLKKSTINNEQDFTRVLSIEDIKSREEKTPKERTSLLINNMSHALYPFRTKVQDSLNELTSELRTYDCKFKYDKDLDKKSFKFEAYIDSEEKRDLVVRTLKNFSWQRFSQIMDGQIDV